MCRQCFKKAGNYKVTDKAIEAAKLYVEYEKSFRNDNYLHCIIEDFNVPDDYPVYLKEDYTGNDKLTIEIINLISTMSKEELNAASAIHWNFLDENFNVKPFEDDDEDDEDED